MVVNFGCRFELYPKFVILVVGVRSVSLSQGAKGATVGSAQIKTAIAADVCTDHTTMKPPKCARSHMYWSSREQ